MSASRPEASSGRSDGTARDYGDLRESRSPVAYARALTGSLWRCEVRAVGTARRAQRTIAALVVASSLVAAVATWPPTSAAIGAAGPVRFASVTVLASTTIRAGSLGAVSCPASTSCMAVGDNARGQAGWTAASEADGTWTWTPFETLPRPSLLPDRLTSVSCPTPIECVAVGYAQHGYAPSSWSTGYAITASATLARGTWRWTTPTELLAGTTGVDRLTSTSCPSKSECVAVGLDVAQQGIATSARRDGTGWSWSPVQLVVPDSTGRGELRAVSCPSSSECVAVGDDDASHLGAPSGAGVTTIATGSSGAWTWSTETALPGPAVTESLTSVSCTDVMHCVAVGRDAHLDVIASTATLTDGTWTWTDSTTLDPGSLAELSSMTCTPASCVAVGTDAGGNGIYVRAAGALPPDSWYPVRALPGAAGISATPEAVACALADDCVTVGVARGSYFAAETVAPPGPARGVRGAAENAEALVRWSSPLFDGGTPIESYVVTSIPRGGTCTVAVAVTTSDLCTVPGLRNGVRYRFTIKAVNALGASAASVPSPPVTPRRFRPPIASPFTKGVLDFVAKQPDVESASVYDVLTGQTWTINPTSVQHTASVVKVDILAALLYDAQVARTPLSAPTRVLATEMIEESDNHAAQDLYVMIGQQPGLTAFDQLVGLTGTTANWSWGFTDTTALDQTRLVRLFALPNRVLDAASRSYGLFLMRHVEPDQAWGISAGPVEGTSVALKNGWYPTEPYDWQVNSIGWVVGKGRSYVVAVLTMDDAEMTIGVTAIEGLSELLWRNLGPRHAGRR
jgi:hypothetical protein